MTRRLCLIVLALFTISTLSIAQQLSLEECIRISLENNLSVKNSKLDIESTEHQVSEARSGLLPTVDLNGQYQYYLNMPSQFIPAATFGGTPGEYVSATLGVPQTTSANVQLTQKLYDQRVMVGLKAARAARTSSSLQLSMTKEDIVYNVTSTYYNIQVLSDNLALLQSNMTSLEKTVKTNETLRKNEIVSSSTYKRLLINLENLRNQYENEKLSQTKYYNMLKYLMNVPLSENVEVMPFDFNASVEDLKAGDIGQRTDIRLQEEQIKLSTLDRKSTLAGYYPTLSANLFHGYTGYYNKFSPLDRINNQWINSTYFSVSLKIPVFDGFTRKYQAKQKAVTIQKDINTLALKKLDAEREIQDAMNNYISNKNLLANSKRSLDLAEQLFKDSNIEYNNGLISITDLLDSQDDLSDARNNYSTALINLKVAELDVKRANGELAKN
ncbi:MAG TPA: TolC family protein [Ohtaekwangia sp.]|uniref:TolC family protein n=1 Tax=Ohtaekwangia sp. TaxID=2066019 RepID=UPI002F95EF7B